MDIYSRLETDHVNVKDLLEELIALNNDDEYRFVIIDQIKSQLIPHARAEEAIFYNSIRVASDTKEVMHGFKEHMEAETLLRTLQVKEKVDLDWKSTAMKLKEALEHHISEEEGKIFTIAKGIFSEDEAKMMGNAFEELKSKTAQQGMIKTSLDMVVNLMPPRFIDKLKDLGSPQV